MFTGFQNLECNVKKAWYKYQLAGIISHLSWTGCVRRCHSWEISV